jgi:hypothetical protein
MPCTVPSIPLLAAFRPLFTTPTWTKMLTLLRGTLLARGRRTVTAALWQTGHAQDPHFSAFHQVLNRARGLAATGESVLTLAHHPDLCPSWRQPRYRHRRNAGTALGPEDSPAWPVAR